MSETVQIRDFKDMLKKSGELYGDRVAFKFKTEVPGVFKTISHKEVREMIDCLGTSLISLLNLKGKRIAVIGENRYEWEVAYLAVTAGTGIVVPLDKALPENELESLIRRSEVEAIFYSKKYEEVLKALAKDGNIKLKHLICMDAVEHNDGIYSFNELIEKGKELIAEGDRSFIDAEVDPEAMTIMLFTSGTTSVSKAVMLCQRNICANLMDVDNALYQITCEDSMLSFLPIHHVFECTIGFLLNLYKGMSTAFCDGIRHIVENLREYQTTFFVCVPAVYEKIYMSIMKNIEKQGKLEGFLQLMDKYKDEPQEVKKEIFKDIHNFFGGHIKLIVSGAAALDPKIEQAYRDLGFDLVQGYGLTESSPVVCVNNIPNNWDRAKYKLGSIGLPLKSVQVKVEDKNDEGVGELVVKGPNVMLGYYGNEEETKAVLADGWLHTGDLCKIDEDGFIYIYGRKKSVIVLKNGKNIFPEEMENLVNKIEGVTESMIYGLPNSEDENDLKIYVEVVYDEAIMQEMYDTTDPEKIREIVSGKIKEINRSMPLYKAIKGVTITKEPIIKTTTGKIKRYEELKKIQKL